MTVDHLRGKDLDDYFEGTEQPEFVLTNEKRGLKRENDDGTVQFEPGSEHDAVAAMTDERVLFVIGDCKTPNRGVDHTISLPYTEIREVETSKGMLKSRLTLTARTGTAYHFLISGREDLTEVAEYVRYAVQYWVAIDRRLEDAKSRLSTIQEYLDDGQPDGATDAYRETRGLLDEARRKANEFRSGDHAMHRRIEQVETRLTLTEIRGHRSRADQYRDDGDRAREAEDYQGALDAYQQARSQYERALDRADDIEHHELGAIQEEYADLEATIEQLQSEPLSDAMAACERAVETGDPGTAIERWTEALEGCHDALSIVHRHDDFEGDVHSLRFQVEWAAGNLARAHRDYATTYEETGDHHRANGDEASAREAYWLAHQHLRKVQEVANEFRSGRAAATVESDIERIEEKHDAVRIKASTD